MDRYLNLIFAGPEQLIPVVIAIFLWVGLAGLGSLVTPGDRLVDANPLFGWATVSTVFTVAGVLVRAPFLPLAILLAALAVLGIIRAVRNGQALFPVGAWRVAVLALPILLIAGAMDPSQWDEFSHWLPAPKYLLAFDGFPNAKQPYNGTHMLSAYPYGWPFLGYLGGLIAGQFVDNLFGILNLLMLFSIAGFAARTGYRIATGRVMDRVGWGVAALIALAATVFNPSFVQKIVLTAYSDVATSVGVGFTVLVAYHFLETLAGRRPLSPRSAAWQFALLAALLVNLRQPNIVLMLVTVTGMVIVALRDPDIPNGAFVSLTGAAVLPGLAVFSIWRLYVGQELAEFENAQATFRPFAVWNTAEIPAIIAQMFVVASKKIGFFGPMIIACYFAIRGLVQYRTAFDRIAILAAVGFLGHNAFLLLTYVGHFGTANALQVVSYWRYNTQIGALAVIFIVIGTLCFAHWKWPKIRFPRYAKLAAVALVVILPFTLPHKLRFDLEAPKPHYFSVARDLRQEISGDAKLWVMDPQGTGESAVITRYIRESYGQTWYSAFQNSSVDALMRYLSQVVPSEYMLVHSTADGLSDALGIPLAGDESYLLRRDVGGWNIVRRWPKTAGRRK